jgi:hypothetical protein
MMMMPLMITSQPYRAINRIAHQQNRTKVLAIFPQMVEIVPQVVY